MEEALSDMTDRNVLSPDIIGLCDIVPIPALHVRSLSDPLSFPNCVSAS